MKPYNHLIGLIQRFDSGEISRAEFEELFQMIEYAENEEQIISQFRKELSGTVHDKYDRTYWTEVFKEIQQQTNRIDGPVYQKDRNRHLWVRFAAAAVLVIAVTVGLFYSGLMRSPFATQELVGSIDLPPGQRQAHIILSDGQELSLDQVHTGAMVIQGKTKMSRDDDGKLVYDAESDDTQLELINTLHVPRGSQVVNMQLADGTKVWINAASTLRYPVAYVGDTRWVEVDGEAYFEVAHHKTMPFILRNKNTEVRVLGTHFHLMAYADEPYDKVTLLEGAVQVNRYDERVVLAPGQQARIKETLPIAIAYDVDLAEIMAFKDGLFRFDLADIESIMRQLARWYDIEVVYEGTINVRFGGTISRQVNASRVFEMLEHTQGVTFEILSDNQVVVRPYE